MSKQFTFGLSRETAWSTGFTMLLPLFTDYIESERDLEDIRHSDDVALSLWARDRDVAKARLKSDLSTLHRLPVRLPEDRPLQQMVSLIDRMLAEHEDLYPRQLHREMMGSFFARYQVAGFGPIAQHRNAMLIQARHLLDALVKLLFHDHLPAVEDWQKEVSEDHDQLVSAL